MEAYCEKCEQMVESRILLVPCKMNLDGVGFGYTEKGAFCCRCGRQVYVSEIHDENCAEREAAYMHAYGTNEG